MSSISAGSGGRRSRRWWAVPGGVGVLAGLWYFFGPSVLAAFTGYVAADLQTRDQLSSAASLWVAIASLLVAMVGLVVQSRQRLVATVGAVHPAATAGMISLAPPETSAAEDIHGRTALIDELCALFARWSPATDRVRVLHGLGGSGKTTVALQVAHRLARRGVNVWWISAAEDTDLQSGMRQLARRLGANAHELSHDWAENAPDVLWRHLMLQSSRWLLIIDNADDLSILTPAGELVAAKRGWIRPVVKRNGAIIITTREGSPQAWGLWCRLQRVAPLSTADGASVLLGLAGTAAGGPGQAAALSARLGGLPLALRLAGTYLRDANRFPLPGSAATFTAYQALLQTQGLEAVFADGDPASRQARGVIGQTWELSLNLLERRGLGQARTLLRLLCSLADTPVPYQLILDPALLAVSPLFPGLDAGRLRGLLRALDSLSLLELDAGGPANDSSAPATLRIHPLVRDTSRRHLIASGHTGEYLALAIRLVRHAVTGIASPGDPGTWPAWHSVTPHCLHLAETVGALPEPDDAMTAQMVAAALHASRYLSEIGLYNTALAQAATMAQTARRVLGDEHPQALAARHHLADWTGNAGDPAAARDLYITLLPILDRILGPDHPDVLASHNNFAHWTGKAGDPVTAREQFAALLPRRERALGTDHPDTLTTRHNLARWIGYAGDAAGARNAFAELLPDRERILGPEHPQTLTTRSNLANWTGRAGDPVTARDECAALVPVHERVLGAEHPGTLATRHNLAHWTGEAGDASTAHTQFSALVPVQERVLGTGHPDTIASRRGLIRWTRQTVGDGHGRPPPTEPNG